MIIAALVGILLLVVAAYYSSLNASVLPKWFVGLIRDVGTAVLVAVITAVTIELFVNARVRREIGEDVFQATFRRFLPDVLYWQVKDHILQSPVLRRDWSVQLQVLDRASNAPLYDEARRLGGDDIYLVEYKVSYRLENLTTTPYEYPIEGGIDLDCPFPTLGIPRFTSVLLGGDDVDARPAEFAEAEAIDVMSDVRDLSQDGIDIRKDHGELIFHAVRRLPPRTLLGSSPDEGAQLSVYFALRRALRVPGMIVLSASAPADGIRISVVGTPPGIEFDVTAQHPDKDELRRPVHNEWLWLFRAGILPWQGFIIRASTPRSRQAASLPAAVHQ